jgi:integrase
VADLCDLYLADAEAGRLLTRRGRAKKASTIDTDRSRIERHIKPLLGTMKVSTVTRADVERFMHAVADGETALRVKLPKKRALSNVRGGKGAASRTLGLLGAIFAYAERKRMVAQNPARGVIRYADGKRERRLSDAEYAALGRALAALEAEMWPPAVACARFLALTGWRSGEALTLRWGMVDLARRTALRRPEVVHGGLHRLKALHPSAATAGGRNGGRVCIPAANPSDINGLRAWTGGGSGIRTHDTVSGVPAFQASALDHSAIPPGARK